MAIARGAGTEIIRTHHFTDVDATDSVLIFGVAHHVYTVLSVVAYCNTLQAAANYFRMWVYGYDSKAGTTGVACNIFRHEFAAVGDTYIWNDKFSFNGNEPTDFAGPMDSIVKQDAIADQAQATAQYLKCRSENAADNFHVTVTFIDQNNA